MDPLTLSRMQETFASEKKAYVEVTKKLQAMQEPRAQYLSQLQENEMVKEEMDRLEDDATVYKLVGPVLIKQDLDDAKQNIATRLKFIQGNIDQAEAKIEELQKKRSKHEQSLQKIQGIFQDLMHKQQIAMAQQQQQQQQRKQ